MSTGAHTAGRAARLVGGLVIALLIAAMLAAAPASAEGQGEGRSASGPAPGATASITNGRTTTIREWPWQVALTVSRQVRPKLSTARRFFCGGALLGPRLVITAGHCVADLNRNQVRQVEVVSGRSNLNSNRGEIARVDGLRMPLNKYGKRRYRTMMGAADWDVALLILASPLSAEPIKLAGPVEAAVSAKGRVAWATGWGVTRPFAYRGPARLQLARQTVMGKGLCRRTEGSAFKPERMICAGAPGGHASTCNGDSGGPLVVGTSAGFRLIGLTSFGDLTCGGMIPSVFTRVAGDQIRRWVAGTAINLTGSEVVGSGGTLAPPRVWCRIPAILRLRPGQARRKLESANCRLGRVRTDRWANGRKGRIVGTNRIPGWLAPPGFRLKVWLAP